MALKFNPPSEVAVTANDFGPSATALDSGTALLLYITSGATYETKAVVVTVAGTVATAHIPIIVDTSSTGAPLVLGVVRLDSTHAVATYLNGNGDIMAVAFSVSGTTVTAGTPTTVVLNANWEAIGSLATLDAGHAITTWVDGSFTGQAVVLGISGLTVTLGATASLGSMSPPFGYVTTALVAPLDSSRVLVAGLNSNDAVFLVLSYSGGVLTAGSPAVLSGGGTHQWYPINNPPSWNGSTAVGLLLDTMSGPTFNKFSAIAVSISGSTVTLGSLVALSSPLQPQVTAAMATPISNVAVLLYANTSWNAAVLSQVPDFSSVDTVVATPAPHQTMSIVTLSSTSGVAFNDDESGFFIMAVVFTVGGSWLVGGVSASSSFPNGWHVGQTA